MWRGVELYINITLKKKKKVNSARITLSSHSGKSQILMEITKTKRKTFICISIMRILGKQMCKIIIKIMSQYKIVILKDYKWRGKKTYTYMP